MKRISFFIGLILFAVVTTSAANGQEDREELAKDTSLQSVIDKLAESKSFSLYGSNGFGTVSRHYVVAKRLNELANVAQLDSLSHNGQTSLVKATAFAILCGRKDSVHSETITSIVLDNLPDTSIFFVNSFDVFFSDDVSSFITEMAFSSQFLTNADSALIDSLILYDDKYSFNSRFMTILRNTAVHKKNRERIIEVYTQTKRADLLPYIAIYQNEADIPLLLEALEDYKNKIDKDCIGKNNTGDAIEAITYWPHPAFRDAVAEYRTTYASCNHYSYVHTTYMFYYVLQQEPEWAIPFIEETINICKNNERVANWDKNFAGAVYRA